MASLSKQAMSAIIYGPASGSIRSKASPKQWKKIVRTAKKRGVTIDSLVSGTPAPLQERTTASLRRQAKKTIASAYKPVYSDLNSQAAQVKALDAKRQSDNAAYRDWLNQQYATLQQANSTFNTDLNNRQQALASSAQQTYATAAQQAATTNSTRSGSTTLGNQEQQAAQSAIQPSANLAGSLINSQQQATIAQEKNGGDRLAVAAANSMASQAAADAKRQSDTWAALSEISSDKSKQKLAQASDTAKEVARLLDAEVTKANAVTQNSIAAQSLGIKQDQLAETTRHNKAGESNAATANKLKAEANRIRNKLGTANYNLAAQKLNDAEVKDFYQRIHGLGPYKPGSKKSGAASKPMTRSQQNLYYKGIDHAQGVVSLLKQSGKTPSEIRNALKTGGAYTVKDGTQKGRKITWGPMDSTSIDAAFDLTSPTGALSPTTVAAIHSLGVTLGNKYPLLYASHH